MHTPTNDGDASEGARFAPLRGHKYCELVTFRRTGTPVGVPVWFAADGDALYVKTEDPSGKVKRIRNDARVRVAACGVLGGARGPSLDGVARILPPSEVARAERVLRARYGVGRRLFTALVEPIFRWRGLAHVYLEIVPANAAARSAGR